MKKWVLAAAAALGVAGSAQGAVLTLQGVSGSNGNFTFNYQGTLGPDEGLRTGDRLVIFDFAGYIDGSIFSNNANVAVSTEFTSPGTMLAPGATDDANLTNLVFTYTGPNFRNSGGPFASLDFNGLGARSVFGNVVAGDFFTLTTKNNPDNQPAGSNTPIFTIGSVSTPGAVPEPATWAMLVGGFGLAGSAMRRRQRISVVAA